MDIAVAATSVDWVARGIAIAGVCVGATSIAVTAYLWRRTGWHLEVTAFYHIELGRRLPAQDLNKVPKRSKTEKVDITVTNTGRTAAVVSDIGVELEYRPLRRLRQWIPQPLTAQPEGGKLPKTLAPSEELRTQLVLGRDLAHVIRYRAFARTARHTYKSRPKSFVFPPREQDVRSQS